MEFSSLPLHGFCLGDSMHLPLCEACNKKTCLEAKAVMYNRVEDTCTGFIPDYKSACPFCGYKPILHWEEGYMTICTGCNVQTRKFPAIKMAIDAWDNRYSGDLDMAHYNEERQ